MGKYVGQVIESRLSDFAKRFSEQNSSSVEQAVKKARREQYTCKRKGNQQQLDHSLQVLDKLDEASDALKHKSYEKVKVAVEADHDAEAQVECDRMHLLSFSSDEFSVKGGSNCVKGRLKSSLNFWVETLDAPDFVLDMIRRGYRLPFAEYPAQCCFKNNRSALQHPEFVAEAISELLSNGCIVEHEVPPFCVNPLTVAEGKKFTLGY
ncbi:hypothetical protein ACROYT_G000422 [Oculina patagonica]